jgi:hypothetical protein
VVILDLIFTHHPARIFPSFHSINFPLPGTHCSLSPFPAQSCALRSRKSFTCRRVRRFPLPFRSCNFQTFQPANHFRPKSFRMRSSGQIPRFARFWPKLSVCNSFRMRRSKKRLCKPFRMRRCKKMGGRVRHFTPSLLLCEPPRPLRLSVITFFPSSPLPLPPVPPFLTRC